MVNMELENANKRITELEDVLKFYADPSNWYGGGHGEPKPPIYQDHGHKAFQILYPHLKEL